MVVVIAPEYEILPHLHPEVIRLQRIGPATDRAASPR